MSIRLDSPEYAERVYGGVLGKIIGVYLGAPVEGMAYEEVERRFGEVSYYVHDQLAVPLVAADDDISGPFTFARAVLDKGGMPAARDVGDTWLNYIIEDRTILWWGGYGRSTEQTAYLHLKDGIDAPASGSIALNGSTLAEQIGAQIFSDPFALMCPGDPEKAARLSRAAASVSHDGNALEVTGYLAAVRALAFDEPDLGRLLLAATPFTTSPEVLAIVSDVLASCDPASDWRSLRSWADDRYGYHRYPGPCHALSNFALTLVALVSGADDFVRSVMVAASAGFDSDSNAGVVGCINGVRLGPGAIPDHLRLPVADQLLVVSADGGECVTDAAREAEKIIASGRLLAGQEQPARRARFHFPFEGSVQGFTPCPVRGQVSEPVVERIGSADGGALRIRVTGDGVAPRGHVSTLTAPNPLVGRQNFSTSGSPTLYPGQIVHATLSADGEGVQARLYVLFKASDSVRIRYGEPTLLDAEPRTIAWTVPAEGNLVPFRIGVALTCETDGRVARLHQLDWRGAPLEFRQSGMLSSSIWETRPPALDAWVSSADNFEADFAFTYAIAHHHGLGLSTIGTRDWDNYTVSSRVRLHPHKRAGLVIHAHGHRRFLAGVLTDGQRVEIIEQRDSERRTLASVPFDYELDRFYDLSVTANGARLTLCVDGVELLTTDADPASGGAGFIVEGGTLTADGFRVHTASNPAAPERKAF